MLDNLQLLFVYAPVMNVQMILDGIFIGAVFALAAYGLALVWGVMVMACPRGFVIIGGYIAFTAPISAYINFCITVHCSYNVYIWSRCLSIGNQESY